jgi:hypothetical protein
LLQRVFSAADRTIFSRRSVRRGGLGFGVGSIALGAAATSGIDPSRRGRRRTCAAQISQFSTRRHCKITKSLSEQIGGYLAFD